jgi:hypothetical protein
VPGDSTVATGNPRLAVLDFSNTVKLAYGHRMDTTLRQRRRDAATREILDAAREQMAVHGPAGLALRSVARSLGMTVQALYH